MLAHFVLYGKLIVFVVQVLDDRVELRDGLVLQNNIEPGDGCLYGLRVETRPRNINFEHVNVGLDDDERC